MKDELKKQLTCTMCGEVKETHSNIAYSQGDRVCLDCKEKCKESDRHAFDRDWYTDRI